MARIGIFGGSFNPIHNGHIALARQLLRAAALDEVWLMVSPQNPLKPGSDLLPASVRYDLAVRALSDSKVSCGGRLHACDFEFSLPKPTYTWTTLQRLRERYDHHFVLVIGADNWQLFDSWRNHDDIVRNFEIVVYPREGSEMDAGSLPSTVHLADVPLFPVSSTEVRRRVRVGESIAGLVPEQVEEEIACLYGGRPVAAAGETEQNSNQHTI